MQIKDNSLTVMLLGLISLGSTCRQNGDATVTCGRLARFEDRVGTNNAPNFALGTIVVLNTRTKRGTAIGVAAPTATQVADSPVVADDRADLSEGASVVFSATVPATVQAGASTQITRSLSLHLTNERRRTINDVPTLVAQSPLAQTLRTTLAQPDTVAMVISAITYADALQIGLKNGTNVDARANVVTYGDFSLHVSYQCSDIVQRTGSQFGALFKYTFVRVDPNNPNAFAIDTSASIELSEYNLSAAIM